MLPVWEGGFIGQYFDEALIREIWKRLIQMLKLKQLSQLRGFWILEERAVHEFERVKRYTVLRN